jgi:hypothetical protein
MQVICTLPCRTPSRLLRPPLPCLRFNTSCNELLPGRNKTRFHLNNDFKIDPQPYENGRDDIHIK